MARSADRNVHLHAWASSASGVHRQAIFLSASSDQASSSSSDLLVLFSGVPSGHVDSMASSLMNLIVKFIFLYVLSGTSLHGVSHRTFLLPFAADQVTVGILHVAPRHP